MAPLPPYLRRGRPVLAKALKYFSALPLALLLIFATALPVMAGPFEDAVANSQMTSFPITEEASAMLATGGNPLAYPSSARCRTPVDADPETKKVYVTEPDGKIIDAAPAHPLPAFPMAPRPCV